jgi:hypothetical protein
VGVFLTGVLPPKVWQPLAGPAEIMFNLARVLIVLEGFRRYYNDLYILGRRRIAHHGGRFWFNLRLTNVKYVDIREIELQQSILARVLGYGSIMISTASKTDNEVVLKGIHSPNRYYTLISDRRLAQQKELGMINDAGGNAGMDGE